MLIRHAMGFWNEFIGDNYVRRAGGRHGDRGTFEYYLQYIGYGMFPWSGIVALGTPHRVPPRSARQGPSQPQLAAFASVWSLVGWVLVTLVNTKFHHYILPALPPLAILAGLCIDELIENKDRLLTIGMFVIGAPLTFLCGRDLAAFPPRILWMFNYDYVNMPGTGRPWPLVSLYGDRYEYGTQLFLLAALVLATLATLAVRPARDATPSLRDGQRRDLRAGSRCRRAGVSPWAGERSMIRWARELAVGREHRSGARLAVLLLVAAIAVRPVDSARSPGAGGRCRRGCGSSPDGVHAAVSCRCSSCAAALRGLRACACARSASSSRSSMLAVVWTGFLIDKLFIELSPHWAQKHVIAAYYANRRSPDEKLIAWQLYWRGENFYTKNEIYKDPNALERTVFLGDRNVEKMQAWFKTHAGKRVFFVVERVRYESLRGILPAASKSSLQIVDQSNNKLYSAGRPFGASCSCRADEPPCRQERHDYAKNFLFLVSHDRDRAR